MKKVPELDIDSIKRDDDLLINLRRAQQDVALFQQRERKVYLEMEMTHYFWQFKQNVQERPSSAPAKLCSEKKKKLIRYDAFTGMEPIAGAAAAAGSAPAKK